MDTRESPFSPSFSTFVCASLSPIDLAHSRLAVETARAGGVGVLDAVHMVADRMDRAHANLQHLLNSANAGRAIRTGLRVRASQLDALTPLLDACAPLPHWLIVCEWSPETLPSLLARLAHPQRSIWLEVGASLEVEAVDPSLTFSGWSARGAECGGLTGTESAFILAQHLARQPRPFLVRGGIGLHSAAACRLAGAAGVILDDAVLLVEESPLPPRWQHQIGHFGLADTVVLGRRSSAPVRVVDRPDVPATGTLRRQLEETDGTSSVSRDVEWRAAVEELVGWDDPARRAWPLGESAGSARTIAARYRTVGRLVRAVLDGVDDHIRTAAQGSALAPDSPLARSHATRYPIVQGPMTRVSDRVEFAAEVGAAGGLPMLALALMRGPEAQVLLDGANRRLSGQPWGVGILGFVPPELRDEQLKVVERVKPPFVLVSGGRPDQAARFEALGIRTYLHAPAPLLAGFLADGARRLIFEGGECGGHVGPLHSFALWDFVVDTLVREAAPSDAADIHVLFAGGIHDALSAAMVAALAAPLTARGVKIGVLMGTAYLFTREAVESEAITPIFQRQAVASRATATIETGPGHIIRCAPTQFTDRFAQDRRSLRRSGLAGHALRDALEALVVGRSRIASKGLLRDGDRLVQVDERQQLEDGLYMLGDAAALRHQPTTISALHADVAVEGAARLRAAAEAAPSIQPQASATPADVAIIGASCLVPGARDVGTFWRNLLDRTGAIAEIPQERWDWRLYYDPDPAARDRIYSRWGGFVDPIPFDPVRFGIPPKSLASITIPQLIALELTRRALCDAGFGDSIPDDRVRARTAVVFGTGNTADIEQLYMTRAALPLIVPQAGEDILSRLPEWTEESYPGLLANVVAGRVANRFDLGGLNVTLDAACASSLAALDLAVRELAEGRSDLVIAGGLEFEQSPQAFMGFSRTRALSPRGRADVFDRQADGIVISEGGVVLVLKRLTDAERDGDRIYAVIKSVAGSSDGRGLSLTAPKPQGQRLAIDRAYAMAGIDPSTIGLYEAHGTGTAVGDAAEVETIGRALADYGSSPHDCVIGSAKSLIGHTRTAAGMVALLKTALSLYHQVLPPHAGVTHPLPALDAANTPLRLLSEPRPWLADSRGPRRAGVSAFGFGGTNYHTVLEEHGNTAPCGAAAWPVELFVLAAADREALVAALRRLDRAAQHLEEQPHDGSAQPPFTLCDLAYVCAVEARASSPSRLALIAGTAAELRLRIHEAAMQLSSDAVPPEGICCGTGAPDGRLAFLFPGQGSQHPGMGSELTLFTPEGRRAFETADRLLTDLPVRMSRLVMPGSAFDEGAAERQKQQLADTCVAQPAIGALSCAMLDLASRLQIAPAAVAGHSYGELVALHAAGSLGREDLLMLSGARGRAMSKVGPDSGAMAVIALSERDAAQYLDPASGVVIANLNAPGQIVVSGPSAGVVATVERVHADGHTAFTLPVSGAFHSPLMVPARARLEAALAEVIFKPPSIPVHANRDGRPYPADSFSIRARLAAHLEQRVDFVAQVEAMYRDGIRLFIELGPGRALTGLVRKILADRPHQAITADGGLRGWLGMIAEVFAAGHPIDVAALFDGRRVRWIDLDRLPQVPAVEPAWYLDGGRVWKNGAAAHPAGAGPFLNLESAATAPGQAHARAEALPPWPTPGPAADGRVIVEAYRAYEATMRHFLDQQERMLNAALQQESIVGPGRGDEHARPEPTARVEDLPAAAPVLPVESRLLSPSEQATSFDRHRLLELLIGIVSERTGYAARTLGLDLDLEADLGIDSIKRIEIIASLSRALPASLAVRLQAQIDRLSRQRSLNAIADLLVPAFAETAATDKAADSTKADGEPCARFVMRGLPRPLEPPHDVALSGLHLVTEDVLGVAPLLVDTLSHRGADARLIPRDVMRNPESLADAIADLRANHGPVAGILHAAPIGREIGGEAEPVDAWRQEAALTTKRLFQILQICGADLDLAQTDPRVLAVTAMGGDWGRTRSGLPGSEMAGGCHGLLRSFEREHPNVGTRVVDVEPGRAADELAALIAAEYFVQSGDREIGYVRGQRSTYVPEQATLSGEAPADAWRPRAGWTVLATGGARGITAELCREIAQPGVRLILVGRGRDPIGHERLSPEAQERRQHIGALREMGAEVEYHALDVRDEVAFGGLIHDLYRRFGRIDAVLHGAGIIEDQRFESKSSDSFDRVFDTKVDSALVLARHLRADELKWIVFFGSVSGRFGNQGQADYAAANETANRIAWMLKRRWTATRVVSINWGPWQGAGMASEAVRSLLVAQGLEIITPEAGRRFFTRELAAGVMDDVEVVAGDGPWKLIQAGASREAALT